MLAYILINREKVNNNEPDPITIQFQDKQVFTNSVHINGPCTIRYNPSGPRPVGARCWIETEEENLEYNKEI